MRCDLAGFFPKTPRRVGLDFLAAAGVTALRASSVLRESARLFRGMIRLQAKKAGLELLQASQSINPHINPAF